MITTCTGCQARFRLAAAKVPQRQIRVRCPACGTVFDLDGTRRDAVPDLLLDTPPRPIAEPRPAPAPSAPAARSAPPILPGGDLVLEPAAAFVDSAATTPPPRPEAPRPAPPPPAASKPAPPPIAAATATAVAEPPRAHQSRRTRRDKTEMLARALVSDILVYNREARDRALADGNLLEVLGPEIKKSWELYKEKVGAETATGTTYFKDALNDILADGQTMF